MDVWLQTFYDPVLLQKNVGINYCNYFCIIFPLFIYFYISAFLIPADERD